MFTGIIEGKGKLLGKRSSGGGLGFEIEADFTLTSPKEGESIACNGVCLTAYAIHGRRFCADVSPETLSRTSLGNLTVGAHLNLERALRVSDRLGGHIVSGHVDCLAEVQRIDNDGSYTIFRFAVPQHISRYVVEKGSVTLDGISLTVNSCEPGNFSVSIIPHTLKVTTLGYLRIGSKVNVEVDIIGKYIEQLLLARSSAPVKVEKPDLDAGFLAEHGFI